MAVTMVVIMAVIIAKTPAKIYFTKTVAALGAFTLVWIFAMVKATFY
jgi:hypothetical protein